MLPVDRGKLFNSWACVEDAPLDATGLKFPEFLPCEWTAGSAFRTGSRPIRLATWVKSCRMSSLHVQNHQVEHV